MPLLTTFNAASSKPFGFTRGGFPSFIAVDILLAGANGASNGGGGQVLPVTTSLGIHQTIGVVVGLYGSGASTTFGANIAHAGYDGGGYGGAGGSSYNGNGGGGGDLQYWPSGGSYSVGGGAGGAGGGGTNGYATYSPEYAYGGNGGNGVPWAITGEYFGGGLGGAAVSIDGSGNLKNNSANGSAGAGATANGVAIISYVYPIQLYTGGTITSTGSGATKRWFHRFTSSGTLTNIY